MTSRRKAAAACSRWEADVRVRAYRHARHLAVAIASNSAIDAPRYDLGIVLQPSERVWHCCPAHYQWRETESRIDQRISAGGYRSTARTVTVPRTFTSGWSEWLITNYRLATRTYAGEVVAIHWSGITGLTVDLGFERVVIDGIDHYHGELIGPAIAPIAVAAIAACHGPHALLDHPALAPLRTRSAESNFVG